jgi:hypothetical protein
MIRKELAKEKNLEDHYVYLASLKFKHYKQIGGAFT